MSPWKFFFRFEDAASGELRRSFTNLVFKHVPPGVPMKKFHQVTIGRPGKFSKMFPRWTLEPWKIPFQVNLWKCLFRWAFEDASPRELLTMLQKMLLYLSKMLLPVSDWKCSTRFHLRGCLLEKKKLKKKMGKSMFLFHVLDPHQIKLPAFYLRIFFTLFVLCKR